MAFIPLRRARLNQPSGEGIDWSNPLAKGLISVADARGYDSVTGVGTLYNGSAISRIPTKGGIAVNFDQNQLDFKCAPYADTNQTHLVVADIASGTWKVAACNHGMVLRRHNGVVAVASRNHGNQFDVSRWTGMQTIVHRVGNSEQYDQKMFIDGVESSWVANVASAETLTNGGIVTLGGSYIGDRSAATWWGKPVMLSIRWNRALTDGEIASISANPWQIFQ